MKSFLLVVISALVLATPGRAASIVEYFNGYGSGSSTVPLAGLGSATGGWAGAWAYQNLTGPGYRGDGGALTYSAAGYSDFGNLVGAEDGFSRWFDGGNGDVASRLLETPLTGTIWISVLSTSSSDTGRTLLWLTGNTSFGVFDRRAQLTTAGAGIAGPDDVATGVTHLNLARVTVNVSGINDRIEFWLNPTLSGGVDGLGAPTLSNIGSESDLFGNGIESIGMSFRRSGSAFDALRLSNDPEGFQFVTTGVVPEPGVVSLLFAGAATVLIFLRRRQR